MPHPNIYLRRRRAGTLRARANARFRSRPSNRCPLFMPICHSLRFIYIHVPKCAGSSVKKSLKTAGARLEFTGMASPQEKTALGSTWLHHVTAAKLRTAVPERVWETYYKFAFIRNPWDLMVSFYHFHKMRSQPVPIRQLRPKSWQPREIVGACVRFVRSQVQHRNFKRERPHIIDRFKRIQSFEEWIHAGIYARPCTAFVTDSDGSLLVDFIARFENLHQDFGVICQRLGIAVRLEHLMRSEHRPYREYYTPELREVVAKHFENDLRHFDYKF